MANVISRVNLFLLPMVSSSILTAATPKTSVTVNHTTGDSASAKFNRSLACYVSDALAGAHDQQCVHADNVSFDTRFIPELAIEKMNNFIDPKNQTAILSALREWWGVWSYALREQTLNNQVIATDLHTFQKMTSFAEWPRDVVLTSHVKGKTRVIYRSPESFSRGISVAQTLDTVSDDLTAKVLETEVAIDRADNSGNTDFYSYDVNGRLATTSHFPAGEKPVPGICLGCHHAPESGLFTRLQ